MKIQSIKKGAILAMAAVVCLATSASSAKAQEFRTGSPQVRVAPVVGSPMPGSQPRLGFMGQMLYGYGMRVLGTNYGSPAQRAGLERGDVIFSINGRRILSQYDYNQALRQAAMYQAGFVNLTVRNVRYDMGLSYQEFVNVSTRVIGGPIAMPAMGGGGVAASGAGGGGQIGMAVRSAPQSNQSSGQARQKVKELRSDQVPKMQEGQTGSDQ